MTKKQKKAGLQEKAAELATAAMVFVSCPPQNRVEAERYRMFTQDAMDDLRMAINAAFPKEGIKLLPPVQTGLATNTEKEKQDNNDGTVNNKPPVQTVAP